MDHSPSRSKLREMVSPLSENEDNCATRLRLALTMMDAGIEMMRMNLRRQYPGESEQEIDFRLNRWLEFQPHSADYRCAMYRLRTGA